MFPQQREVKRIYPPNSKRHADSDNYTNKTNVHFQPTERPFVKTSNDNNSGRQSSPLEENAHNGDNSLQIEKIQDDRNLLWELRTAVMTGQKILFKIFETEEQVKNIYKQVQEAFKFKEYKSLEEQLVNLEQRLMTVMEKTALELQLKLDATERHNLQELTIETPQASQIHLKPVEETSTRIVRHQDSATKMSGSIQTRQKLRNFKHSKRRK